MKPGMSEEFSSKDYRHFRRALGASVEQFGSLIGMETEFLRAHEAGDLPVPKPVASVMRYLAQGLNLTEDPESSDVSAFSWCVPVEKGTKSVPMLLHTLYPRFQIFLIDQDRLDFYKRSFAESFDMAMTTFNGKTWYMVSLLIDEPITYPHEKIEKGIQIIMGKILETEHSR